MEYAVTRAGRTLVTLHGGSDTTARDEAREQFQEVLAHLEDDGGISEGEITDTEVYEQPTAPFEPYTVALEFTATTVVDAADDDRAAEIGSERIAETFASVDIDGVSFTSSPVVSSA
ncbi:hypothetical protein [Natrarchaeobius chitinivorans]|uniref:Uncharacterized protein n=1 Tax=Natrarchaeobius chitinivorans TaxID=1679083 RepID=A0A3N6P3H1_NATCH|nr:hypothetical protein [Natrarchaeobius chitinivorans]RQG92259.1 hypothetical protein EA473_17265 [Natrarchaeobius chitinivorans]